MTLRKLCLGFARALEGLSRASPSLADVGDDENDDVSGSNNTKNKIEDLHWPYGACLIEASLMEHEFGVDDSGPDIFKTREGCIGDHD